MALTFVSAVGDNGAITSGKRSFSVTRAAGEGFLLVVLFKHTWGPAEEITGVKWDPAGDNQSFTQAAARVHSVSNRRSALFYLPAPTSVKTGSVEVTTAAADDADRNLYCLLFKVSGHDTTAMLTGTAVDRAETDAVTNDLPVTISSQVGDLVVAMGAMTANGAYIDAGDAANYNENTDSALTVFGGTKAGAASVTVTFGYSDVTNYDNSLYAVSLAPGAAGETITLTPAPASVQVGSTRTFTATRSAPAGAGGVTYNLTSSATGVATVPATATILEGNTTITFNATGVSVGTANITITNAADSGETDTVTLTVTAVTTKKAKFLVHPDFASATGITIEVNEAPSGGALTGAKLGFTTGVAAEATLEGGQAVIKVNAADVGASGLAAATSVRAIFKGLAASGSALGSGAEAGSVVVATGTIIEE